MTAMTLLHDYVSAIADDGNASLIQPQADWNDEHEIFLGINAQTGTSYAVLNADKGSVVTFTNAAAIAASIAQAGAGSAFLTGWFVWLVCKKSSAGSVTLTPATSTVDGAATLIIPPGHSYLVESDGTNFQVSRGATYYALDTIASATTTELGKSGAEEVTVSGTVTITGFGSTAPTGAVKDVYFSGALLVTHNGTSLIIPGAASITTVAGDMLRVRHEGSGNWRVLSYTRGAVGPDFEVLGKISAINTQTASYTAVLADFGKVIEMNVATANNLTIPQNSSVAYATGTYINVTQYGAGQTTLVADTNVTLRSRNGLKLAGQYAVATLYKRGTNEWVCGGDLAV